MAAQRPRRPALNEAALCDAALCEAAVWVAVLREFDPAGREVPPERAGTRPVPAVAVAGAPERRRRAGRPPVEAGASAVRFPAFGACFAPAVGFLALAG